MSTNPLQFIFDLFDKFQGFAGACKSFLFYEIGVGDLSFTVWQLIGGGALVTVLVMVLIKLITPLL